MKAIFAYKFINQTVQVAPSRTLKSHCLNQRLSYSIQPASVRWTDMHFFLWRKRKLRKNLNRTMETKALKRPFSHSELHSLLITINFIMTLMHTFVLARFLNPHNDTLEAIANTLLLKFVLNGLVIFYSIYNYKFRLNCFIITSLFNYANQIWNFLIVENNLLGKFLIPFN